MQAHLYQENLEKLKRGKPANKSREKGLKSFGGQNHENLLIPTPGFQVRKFESGEFENNTGKSFSEALILPSFNPQNDKRLFIEFPEKYKFTTCCVQKLFFVFVLTSKTIFVNNML